MLDGPLDIITIGYTHSLYFLEKKIFFSLNTISVLANIVDPDKMTQYAAFYFIIISEINAFQKQIKVISISSKMI